MTWNAKRELVKRAAEIAKDKYPAGFNKDQLVECGKEVYGGFGSVVASGIGHKKIRTMEDVNNMGNAMAQIDGHYPVGMSTCFIVGINGDCGGGCPAYLSGECENDAEMFYLEDMTEEEIETHIELYGDPRD